jgi:hypothetical protein
MWHASHPTLLGRTWRGMTLGPARGISCRWLSRPVSSKASFGSVLNHWNLPTRINQPHAGLIPYRDTERLVGHIAPIWPPNVGGQRDLPNGGHRRLATGGQAVGY